MKHLFGQENKKCQDIYCELSGADGAVTFLAFLKKSFVIRKKIKLEGRTAWAINITTNDYFDRTQWVFFLPSFDTEKVNIGIRFTGFCFTKRCSSLPFSVSQCLMLCYVMLFSPQLITSFYILSDFLACCASLHHI